MGHFFCNDLFGLSTLAAIMRCVLFLRVSRITVILFACVCVFVCFSRRRHDP